MSSAKSTNGVNTKKRSENSGNDINQLEQQSKRVKKTHPSMIGSDSSSSSTTSVTTLVINNNELEREKTRRMMVAIVEAAASTNPENLPLTEMINIAYHSLKKDFGYPNEMNNIKYKTWYFLLTVGCVKDEKQKLLVRLTKVVLVRS